MRFPTNMKHISSQKVSFKLLMSFPRAIAVADPLGQTHNATSSDHYFHTTLVSFCDRFENWRRTYGVRKEMCAKIMISTGQGFMGRPSGCKHPERSCNNETLIRE